MSALWMRVAANIGNRKVTWRAVMSLGLPRDVPGVSPGLSRAAAVGYLVMFWGGALEAECNGYVDDIPDAQLEAWANWDGAPGVFARFVREHHVTDGRINEWEDWAGVLEATRERERAKKAKQRGGTSPDVSRGVSRGHPGDVPGKSPDKERKGKERDQEQLLAPRASHAVAPNALGTADAPPGSDTPAAQTDEVARRRERRARAPRPPAQFPEFPTVHRGYLHRSWTKFIGGVDFGRFVKAFGLIYPARPAEEPDSPGDVEAMAQAIRADREHVAFVRPWEVYLAIRAFSKAKREADPSRAAFWTVEQFVADYRRRHAQGLEEYEQSLAAA